MTGLLILALGVLTLGSAVFGWPIGYLAKSWWTLFFIVPGITGLITSGPHLWNVFLTLFGFWLLADDQHWLRYNSWPIIAGVFLVFLGIWLIAGSGRWHALNWGGSNSFSDDSDDAPEYVSILTRANYKNHSKAFRGGKISGIFGTVRVDLSDIVLTSYAELELSAVFGTVEIVLPKNVPIRAASVTPVFGSFFNDAVYSPPSAGQPYLDIKGAAVFGSVRLL